MILSKPDFDPDLFRLETLLRHAHFSVQSRRLWRQFDIEASGVKITKKFCDLTREKMLNFVDILLTIGFEIERKNRRRTWMDG